MLWQLAGHKLQHPTALVEECSINMLGEQCILLQEEPFVWTKQWWAVSLLDALSKERPNAIELLGKNMVVWYEAGSGSWNCFEDLCPHRLAPLSGRLVGSKCCCWLHAMAHAWPL